MRLKCWKVRKKHLQTIIERYVKKHHHLKQKRYRKVTDRHLKRMHRYLATLYTDCENFADVNDLISYMPPFRGFTMIRRVNVGTDYKRSFFRLLHPLRYHVHYDLPELYRKVTEREVSQANETAQTEEMR